MNEDLELDATEARVLGVLIEKELTTPDQYPLSLNATTLGCNQKSNRHPVLDLAESAVSLALDKLNVRGLSGRVHPAGSRVERFRHNAREVLELDEPQLAVLAELLMRGPQTRGDLRGRASRMASMETLEDLDRALQPLLQKGFVAKLPPAAGSRAERYVQLMSPGLHPTDAEPIAPTPTPTPATATAPAPAPGAPPLSARVEALEREVQTLRAQLRGLAEKLGETLEED